MNENYILDYDAFIRSIKRNTDVIHDFLLGAGASISSGIQSAADCIWEWKRDIFTSQNLSAADIFKHIKTDAVRNSIQRWLDNEGNYPELGSPEEYSFYAEKAYPIESDRRKYFQSLAEGKEPYLGYKLLCLLNEAQMVSSIWTTNFDGLVVKAAHQMNRTPVEITLDSIDRIQRKLSRNELLSIALHGDYKYGPLKNTGAELDTQNQIFVQTLIRHLNDKNLIVCGYSGRDKSLMKALAEAYSHQGAGRLYWCGYGYEDNKMVDELIEKARANNREAFYVATDGFDKALIHIAKACFENDDDRKKRVYEILQASKDANENKTTFTIDSRRTDKYLKSNLHPISFPKEFFQFEIEYKDDERPYATIKNLIKGIDISAVPFKSKVFALSTKSLIDDAFKDRIINDIIRVPISKFDIQNVNAFKDLVLGVVVKYFAAENDLGTNFKNKLWYKENISTQEVNELTISVHKAVSLSLFFDFHKNYAFLALQPAIYLGCEEEISKEVRQSIIRPHLEKLFNKQYDDYLANWNETLFKDNPHLDFEYPPNSGSAFYFKISRNVSFAEIFVPNQKYSYHPKEYNKKLTLHRGIQYLEPQLIFTNRNAIKISKDFHPMRGLVNHRPYDFPLNGKVFSNEINIGVICPRKYKERFNNFLNELNQRFKPGVNPDYLLEYPGFSNAYNLAINIPVIDDDKWVSVEISHTENDEKTTAIKLARLITSKLDQLSSIHGQIIVTIFIPEEWQPYRKYDENGESFDLHDYIKAYAATKGIATQLIEEDTINDSLKCQIFWWLSLAFYVKSFRTPWILANTDETTAFAGIGYSITHTKNSSEIVLGCSHIYNSQGQGLKYKLSKIDDYFIDKQSNPFLSYDDAFQFGVSIRELFLNSMDELPHRVVVHKRTHFTKDEIKGITDSLSMANIKQVDLIEINYESNVRYFATNVYQGVMKVDNFPLSRGTCIVVEPTTALLWTHGIVPSVRNPRFRFFLGGRSIPAPLKIKKHHGSSNISTIATEILGLTKMNWNSFDLYTKLPATINSSNVIAQIGKLLSRFEGKTYDYRLFI